MCAVLRGGVAVAGGVAGRALGEEVGGLHRFGEALGAGGEVSQQEGGEAVVQRKMGPGKI